MLRLYLHLATLRSMPMLHSSHTIPFHELHSQKLHSFFILQAPGLDTLFAWLLHHLSTFCTRVFCSHPSHQLR